MSERTNKDNVEREGEGYVRLGTLLKQVRPAASAEAVERLMSENTSVEEKIRRIESIDAALRTDSQGRSSVQGALATVMETSSREKLSAIAAARRRVRLKADPAPSTLFTFLFGEHARIGRLAKGNLLLKLSVFSVALDAAAAKSLLEHLKRDTLPPVAVGVKAALRSGWRFLRKSEYNVLAEFGRLVDELSRFSTANLNPKDPSFIRRLFPLETALLCFHADPSSAKTAIDSLDAVLEGIAFPRRETVVAGAGRILAKHGHPPHLQDFVTAANMARARRYLTPADLLNPDAGPLASATEFDCSVEVQKEIDSYVASSMARLGELAETSEETLRLRTFVERDSAGAIDFGPLVALYEARGTNGASFEKDRDNVLLLASRSAENFLRPALLLVSTGTGGGALDGHGRSIEYDLSQMRGVSDRLMKLIFEFPSLPRARFDEIKSRGALATRLEADGVGLVKELADLFASAGQRIATLLRSIEESRLMDVVLPSGLDPFLARLSPREAFSALASAAFLAALHFDEPSISATIENELQNESQMLAILDDIERLSDAETYREAARLVGRS